ncbi:MAG: outer membrane lipoprotein-sorting protein [Candidatus Latescibacteria bacterium]|nr:outer membrane lipoprotein-sorting protein [Candidatus Latescibacterota bacterium]
MSPTIRHLAAALLLGLAPASIQAAELSPEERGFAVALAADQRDTGWQDNASSMLMLLRNRSGQESTRELRRQALESVGKGAGDKSIIVFDAPGDIQGTALLSHTRILEADDQWLYLPALKRVKRISSGNKSGPFVGSEFAYEDLVSQETEKYDYRFLREEACGDLTCAVVERYPRYKSSGYTRQIVWWDREEYRIHRIEFYDRKNQLLKTLTPLGYQEYAGRYWRPDRMVMENHQNGKGTELVFENWVFATGIAEKDFTASRLRRVK